MCKIVSGCQIDRRDNRIRRYASKAAFRKKGGWNQLGSRRSRRHGVLGCNCIPPACYKCGTKMRLAASCRWPCSLLCAHSTFPAVRCEACRRSWQERIRCLKQTSQCLPRQQLASRRDQAHVLREEVAENLRTLRNHTSPNHNAYRPGDWQRDRSPFPLPRVGEVDGGTFYARIGASLVEKIQSRTRDAYCNTIGARRAGNHRPDPSQFHTAGPDACTTRSETRPSLLSKGSQKRSVRGTRLAHQKPWRVTLQGHRCRVDVVSVARSIRQDVFGSAFPICG